MRRVEKATDPDYWRKLIPGLSVGGSVSGDALEAAPLDARRRSELAGQIREAGYFQTAPLLEASLMERMRNGVEVLRREQWLPVFAFVYDEFWQVTRTPSVSGLLAEVLGPGYRQNARIWCFYIPPVGGSRGWKPHVDGYDKPNRMVVWVPLSDATVENGCIYVIPPRLIPEEVRDFSGLRSVAAQHVSALLHASHALPAAAGSVLGWNFQVIHWGSTCGRAEHPRISVSVEFLGEREEPHPDEVPLMAGRGAPPEFVHRLRAIGKAILDYPRFEARLVRYQGLAERLLAAI